MTLFVTLPAVVALAALPPIDNPLAVPVKPVPGPLNWVEAVIVLPPTVEPLIGVPVIVPPVIATLLAFWVDIVPKPETWVFAIAMFTSAKAVNWPCALTVAVRVLEADPTEAAVTPVLVIENVLDASDKPVPA